jgi:hypothetical protein
MQLTLQTTIPGFNGRYLISMSGKVFDTKNNREIKPHMSGVTRKNYYQVTLYNGSDKHTKRIHSLQAISWLGHVYGDRSIVVDHDDNNPLNNELSNIKIVTNQINCTKDR